MGYNIVSYPTYQMPKVVESTQRRFQQQPELQQCDYCHFDRFHHESEKQHPIQGQQYTIPLSLTSSINESSKQSQYHHPQMPRQDGLTTIQYNAPTSLNCGVNTLSTTPESPLNYTTSTNMFRRNSQMSFLTPHSASSPLDTSNARPETRDELYFEVASSTYVYKSPTEGREGVLQGSLIKHVLESNSDNRTCKRSRTGCLTCRYRKKRCSEGKPSCEECTRLNMKCRWPLPGSEHKNRSKRSLKIGHDEMYHETYGVIKVLRGVVLYKIEE
ncbi:uncharacterized protein C5L36_0C01850 [Pichia kudriavzevii]|uniref:Zn(2)-C6 fungal-type domain-containing protein n=1 Tax=Pichia kudriavzevii TaxID=4909 RepID=A0A099NTI9_PICKU|nr:uncharacterized protein C5L36_0C01850 [Pichia kudriavzevii]AWU76239.1 hypothetical protein C5L36_0C01850 [Pichia kudriavzevii]KGK36170.1 hypothetical protein JL09_g4682 [Pichia kudriavzevii]KGK36173.1 hypothetical protein JL09_g4678 [Pichia kudriavzevii]